MLISLDRVHERNSNVYTPYSVSRCGIINPILLQEIEYNTEDDILGKILQCLPENKCNVCTMLIHNMSNCIIKNI